MIGLNHMLPPEDMVPPVLDLPDGRIVPVCVITVEPTDPDRQLLPSSTWPKALFGAASL